MSSASDSLDHIFKILLIGDAGVGKSSILLQFTDNCFDSNLQSTIGMTNCNQAACMFDLSEASPHA